jgi:large subunit ribosomal protein L5e
LRKRIFGVHVADYMTAMQTEDPDKFAAHFSEFVKTGKKPADVEKMYASAHAAIRKDPTHKATVKKAKNTEFLPRARLSTKQKRGRVQQKLAAKSE